MQSDSGMSLVEIFALAWVFVIARILAMVLVVSLPTDFAVALLAAPYAVLVPFALLCYLLRVTGTAVFDREPIKLDLYETAYLAGEERQAVDAAIARLVNQGVLVARAGDRKLDVVQDLPAQAHPLEQAVHSAIDLAAGQHLEEVRDRASLVVEQIRDRLKLLGLILSDWRVRIFNVVVGLVILGDWLIIEVFFILIRTEKFGGSIQEYLPFFNGILALLLIFVGFVVVWLLPMGLAAVLRGGNDRTHVGNRALRALKEQHSDRVLAAEEKSEELSGNDLVMAMTLWDTGIPDEGPLAELREIFEPATPADADADSGEDEDGCGEDDLDCDVDW